MVNEGRDETGPESPAGVQRRETGSSGAPLPVADTPSSNQQRRRHHTRSHQLPSSLPPPLFLPLILLLPPPLLLLLPAMLCLHKLIVDVNDGSVWSRWPQRALKRQSRCVVSPAHPLRFTLRPHPPPHPPPPIHPSTSAAPSQWALRSKKTRPLFFFSLLNDAASASTLGGDKLLMSGWGGGGGV